MNQQHYTVHSTQTLHRSRAYTRSFIMIRRLKFKRRLVDIVPVRSIHFISYLIIKAMPLIDSVIH